MLVTVVAACSRSDPRTVFQPGDEAVVFSVHRVFIDSFEIGLRRSANGTIELEAYRLGYSGGASGRTAVWVKTTIDSQTYDQITAYLDSTEFRNLEAKYPAPGADGWTWEFARVQAGQRKVSRFWCPEQHTEMEGVSALVAVGKRLIELAGIEQKLRDLSQIQERSRAEPVVAANMDNRPFSAI
jgi:hypothetical protein